MPENPVTPGYAWSLPPARKAQVLAEIEQAARSLMQAVANPIHDWKHVQRVRRQARRAALETGIDPDVADLAALLHDLGRAVEQAHPGANHGDLSAELAAPILARHAAELPPPLEAAVLDAVRRHSRLGCNSPLLAVLKEADALDALGAVGIVRGIMTWAEGPDYDPELPLAPRALADMPPVHSMIDQLHFQMAFVREVRTPGGLALARGRLAFMEAFWEQYRREILEGEEGSGENSRV